MAKQRIVTLTTDFTTTGPYAAAMKGVILAGAPGVTIVDITHDVPPGNILAGAFTLAHAIRFFPPGTVHCVVIDPTVGSDRRILAARYGGQVVIFPDNGVITVVDQTMPLEAIHVLRDERHFQSRTHSRTFHGRDVIAPAAASAVGGTAVEKFGPPPETFKLLELPEPRRGEDGELMGEVLYVDGFGNLISNVPADLLPKVFDGVGDLMVTCGGNDVGQIVAAYTFADDGAPVALINSMTMLEVAINGGSAAAEFGLGVGAEVVVRPSAGRMNR